jgi:hypothetical protein
METFWKVTRSIVAIFLAAFAVDVVFSLLALRNGNLPLAYATLGAAYFLVVLPLIFAFIYAYRAEKEVKEIKAKNDEQTKRLDAIKERLDALSGKIEPTVSALGEVQTALELEKLRQSKGKKDDESK